MTLLHRHWQPPISVLDPDERILNILLAINDALRIQIGAADQMKGRLGAQF